MTTFPNLPNAPIKEAIIDVQINALPVSAIEKIERLIENLPSYAGEKRVIGAKRFELNLEEKGKDTVKNMEPDVLGFRIENQEQGYVAQLKRTGFTLSKLPQYQDFESFRDEARKLWSIYTRGVGNVQPSRMALRYINEFIAPIDENHAVDFESYLTNEPKLPNNMGNSVSHFFCRVAIPDEKFKVQTIVTQTVREFTDTGIPIILDIESFRGNLSGLSEAEIWSFFDVLRDIKNKAFFGSLTDKSLGMFK